MAPTKHTIYHAYVFWNTLITCSFFLVDNAKSRLTALTLPLWGPVEKVALHDVEL
jgi:hypothetical protein